MGSSLSKTFFLLKLKAKLWDPKRDPYPTSQGTWPESKRFVGKSSQSLLHQKTNPVLPRGGSTAVIPKQLLQLNEATAQ